MRIWRNENLNRLSTAKEKKWTGKHNLLARAKNNTEQCQQIIIQGESAIPTAAATAITTTEYIEDDDSKRKTLAQLA